MSDYGYDNSSRRQRSMRTRDQEPEYVQETTYIQRGPGRPSTDLVRRGRDDSIEDIQRDFPPQTEFRRTRYRDNQGVRRSRSVGRRDDYDDDYYSDGGTASRSYHGGRERRYHEDDYQSDDYFEPRHDRRKSKFEGILDDLGLGGAVAAVTGSRSRSRSRGARSRRGSFESEPSTRTRDGDSRKKWQQAVTAAVLTGAAEAWRSRKEPGGLTGSKGRRIATAALSAAGFDAILDKNPNEHSKRHIAESMFAGLVTNRIANGPRDRSASRGRSRDRDGDDERSRSRSRFSLRSLSRGRFGRSQSREPDDSQPKRRGSGLKDLAAAGGIAAIGKAIYDRVRSKSRGRDRDPSRSRSPSEDSFVPSRRQRYGRDRGAPTDDNRVARPRGREEEGGGERKRDSSSSSISTTDLENQRKRTRGPTSAYPPTAYADGNPYAAIPPPPMGSPRQNRY